MNKSSIIKTAAVLAPLILMGINCYGAITRDPVTGIYYANNVTELNEIIKTGNVVVDFSGEKWCQPCKQFASIFSNVAASTPDVKFVKVDVDKYWPKEIRGVPTIYYYENGKKIADHTGYLTDGQFRASISSTFASK